MIVRTPLPKKRRPEETGNSESPNSDGRLVIFEDLPVPEPSHQHSDHMLCTYQCRQLVKADFVDALSSAEKQSQNYQSKLKAMNDDLCKSGKATLKYGSKNKKQADDNNFVFEDQRSSYRDKSWVV